MHNFSSIASTLFIVAMAVQSTPVNTYSSLCELLQDSTICIKNVGVLTCPQGVLIPAPECTNQVTFKRSAYSVNPFETLYDRFNEDSMFLKKRSYDTGGDSSAYETTSKEESYQTEETTESTETSTQTSTEETYQTDENQTKDNSSYQTEDKSSYQTDDTSSYQTDDTKTDDNSYQTDDKPEDEEEASYIYVGGQYFFISNAPKGWAPKDCKKTDNSSKATNDNSYEIKENSYDTKDNSYATEDATKKDNSYSTEDTDKSGYVTEETGSKEKSSSKDKYEEEDDDRKSDY